MKMNGIYLILCCLITTITFPIAIGYPQDSASTNDEYDNLDNDYEPPEEKYETPTSKAQFKDQNKTIHVAEGSIAKLRCHVNNRGKDDQIMWYSTDKRQNKPPSFIAICSVASDVMENERKDVCTILIPNSRERFKDEGQILTLTNVNKADENIVYKCELAILAPRPSIYLELKVHPSDWKETTTIKNPEHQPQSQNFPTTETPKDAASGIEKASFSALVVFALLSYILFFVIPL